MRGLLALVVVVGLAGDAAANLVIVRKVKLADAVASAEVGVVLEVEAVEKVDYAVPAAGGKPCPPYTFIAWRGRVASILFPAAFPPVKAEQRVLVIPASVPELALAAHDACAGDGSKSVSRDRFPGVVPSPGSKLVALLAWRTGYGWSEAVDGSWLAHKDFRKVLKAVGKGTPLGRTGRYRMNGGGADTGASDGMCLADSDCLLAAPSCPGPCGGCPGIPGTIVSMTTASAGRLQAECDRAAHPPPPKLRKGMLMPPPPRPNCAPCPAPPPPPPPPQPPPPARPAPVVACVAQRCSAR